MVLFKPILLLNVLYFHFLYIFKLFFETNGLLVKILNQSIKIIANEFQILFLFIYLHDFFIG